MVHPNQYLETEIWGRFFCLRFIMVRTITLLPYTTLLRFYDNFCGVGWVCYELEWSGWVRGPREGGRGGRWEGSCRARERSAREESTTIDANRGVGVCA